MEDSQEESAKRLEGGDDVRLTWWKRAFGGGSEKKTGLTEIKCRNEGAIFKRRGVRGCALRKLGNFKN